jgi:hypothetical protein
MAMMTGTDPKKKRIKKRIKKDSTIKIKALWTQNVVIESRERERRGGGIDRDNHRHSAE